MWNNPIWLFLFACTTDEHSTKTVSIIDSGFNSDGSIDTALNTDTSDMDDQDTGSPSSADHFSDHFQHWLEAHPEFTSDLTRLDIAGGSFGGFIQTPRPLEHKPILFIHGNSDRASGGLLGGWTEQRQAFLDAGFSNAELYATTYGPADPLYITDYRHDVETLLHIRHFIEAVLAYTGADSIDVVAYSLGVTLARKAILGGGFTDGDLQSVQLGPPLTESIDTFVGIAGANQGLASCYTAITPTCSSIDGLYPGTAVGFNVLNQSTIIQNINATRGYEGTYRYSIWSSADEILGLGCVVWGQNTAMLPEQTGEKSYLMNSHLALKNDTFNVVYAMTQEHRIP